MARQSFVVEEPDESEEISQFGLWEPPYKICLPSVELAKAIMNDKHGAEKINFQFWSNLVDAGLGRLSVAKQKSGEVEKVIEAEVAERLLRWLTEWSHRKNTTPNTLWDLAMCWGARIIATLYRDLEVCRKGTEYSIAYRERGLAWQNLNWVRSGTLEVS